MKNILINLGLIVAVAVALGIWVFLPWFVALALALVLVLWLVLARTGRQTLSVTWVGISSVRQRLGSSSVIVIGIAGVVGVLVAMLSMGAGFQKTLNQGGRDDTAIILRAGAQAEAQSVLLHDDIIAIEQEPGVARDAKGKPLVSAELAVAASLQQKGSGDHANVQFRGVDSTAWDLRPGLKIIKGRKFRTGMQEIDVGQGAERQYAGLAVGSMVKMGRQKWKVVGVFASGGPWDSELWTDRNVLAAVHRRGDSADSVLVKLTSAGAFDAFKAALDADPKLSVEAKTTRQFFADQSAGLSKVVSTVGIVVGVIMAIGAIFGALNCMFAAVGARAREIATLRAIGFRGVPVVVSVMLETMLLALLGGVLGALIVWLVFNGYTTTTLQGLTQVVFQFAVTPHLLWMGLKWALAIGFIGGLFPAVRAARMTVSHALRES